MIRMLQMPNHGIQCTPLHTHALATVASMHPLGHGDAAFPMQSVLSEKSRAARGERSPPLRDQTMFERRHRSGKAVYIAPIKALCSEREEDWKAKFGPLGYRVQMWTGDIAVDEDSTLADIRDADIVLTTPEKWYGDCFFAPVLFRSQLHAVPSLTLTPPCCGSPMTINHL